MMINRLPEYQDYVKHKKNETTGTVIAVYRDANTEERFFDVRGDDNKIYYETPAENWELVVEVDE